MKYLILSTVFCAIICCQAKAQDISTINIHQFSDRAQEVKYNFKYEIGAEGENAIGKTIFENNITLSQVKLSEDTVIIKIEADSTQIIGENKDGEAMLLFAMIGLDMRLKCTSDGKLIELMNKEEVLAEFKQGINFMPDQRKDEFVQQMLDEGEALVYDKMIEVNYGLLLKYLNTDLEVPFESKKDSLIEATLETPKTSVETSQVHTKTGDKLVFKTTVSQKSEEFTQNETSYSITNKPVVTNTEQMLTTDNSGLMLNWSAKTVSKMEGMVMKMDGKIMQEMKSFIQYTSIDYTRLD